MTFPPKPYRSDFKGKLQWYVHHRPTTIAVIVLAVALPIGIALGAIIDKVTM